MNELTWVFGYGSLIWRQDFPFVEARRARIDGWVRRLWQGSHDHRGVLDKPGRVATLIESPEARCFGRAFLIEHQVFEHLDHREKNGYQRHNLDIHFDDGKTSGVTYVAPVHNHAFLGDAPVDEMIEQIRTSRGDSGPNTDYVLELDAALCELGIDDPHIAAIAESLRSAPSVD